MGVEKKMKFKIDVVVEHRDGEGRLVSRQTSDATALPEEQLEKFEAFLRQRLREELEHRERREGQTNGTNGTNGG